RELLERRVDDAHQVFVVDAAPAASAAVDWPADRAAPRLRVARAAAGVGEEHRVARAGVDLHLVEEPRPVLGERAAVDREQRRVALALVEAGGTDEPRVDLRAVLRDRCKALRFDELARV